MATSPVLNPAAVTAAGTEASSSSQLYERHNNRAALLEVTRRLRRLKRKMFLSQVHQFCPTIRSDTLTPKTNHDNTSNTTHQHRSGDSQTDTNAHDLLCQEFIIATTMTPTTPPATKESLEDENVDDEDMSSVTFSDLEDEDENFAERGVACE